MHNVLGFIIAALTGYLIHALLGVFGPVPTAQITATHVIPFALLLAGHLAGLLMFTHVPRTTH
jgi:hypothetical protein